ncbi:mechanosensitive ion channel family protein [Robiginitalea marina]|uniref:Mechanosensitive ion channel family protein n=1 Tax=Robiginitalea marina TaxID=2954105 RepID=A0ABT1AW76_9FLAO|nr:mechanosensitive ion channel domain-containing protein [Robiginitalea marina]MCO5724300.1 mechanosensitive ion channel family protein [Robiginitalea marina]
MADQLFPDPTQRSIFYLSLTLLLMIGAYIAIGAVLRHFGKHPKYLLPSDSIRKVAWPLVLVLFSLFLRMESLRNLLGMESFGVYFRRASTLLFIAAFAWLIIRALGIVKKLLIARYDIDGDDNLRARIVFTQFNILERIFVFIVVVLAIGAALMSFDSIREVGVSIFASAGVAGIIVGFSAQKLIATILAGIQVAITQPIRLDDVVVVEGEWGRVEEITLTFVVVRIWDKRRLVLPTTYFIEKPFQNWTRSSTDLLGTVFIYTDYTVPFDALREELHRIVAAADQWDGEVANIQVTDSRAEYVEIRATVSAPDSGRAWELRVHVREKLIAFLQENYPESIAHQRILINGDAKGAP